MTHSHFLSEQEYLRIGATFGGYVGGQPNQTINSIIDAAAEHEVYAWAFAEAVRAGAASVMCAYNQVDGALACENGEVLQDLLKDELNAHSSVVSDWFAVINGTRAAINGTDINQPFTIWGNTMLEQINNGSLPADILDDKIIRQITPYFALNQSSLPEPDYTRYVANKESKATILAVAQSSLTLLKNVRSENSSRGLPLNNPTDLLCESGGPLPWSLCECANVLCIRSGRKRRLSWTIWHDLQHREHYDVLSLEPELEHGMGGS